MDSELYEIGSDFIPDINNYENVSSFTPRMWFFVFSLVLSVAVKVGLSFYLKVSEDITSILMALLIVPGVSIGFKFDKKVMTWIRFRMTIQERIYDYGESEYDINDF